MKILWFSNSPFAKTGYGNQTQLFVAHMLGLGHEVATVSSFGLESTKMETPQLTMYPGGFNGPHRDQTVIPAAREFDPDVVISLLDAYVLQFPNDPNFKWPWVAWAPVDCAPLRNMDKVMLEKANLPVAYSKFGHDTMKDAGLDAAYVPHGVRTDIFVPLQVTEKFGQDMDTFVVGMVGRNDFHPSRKCIPEMMVAFAKFHEQVPNSIFYMHTMVGEARAGIHLNSLAEELGIGDAVILCNQDEIFWGFSDQYMVEAYNQMDVLLNTSLGEGFGLPIMEAQSCGVPVIATNWSSMPELVSNAGGWMVDGQKFRTPSRSWWKMPNIDNIYRSIVSAYQEWRGDSDAWIERRQTARAAAEEYDFGKVVAPMWDELLRDRYE